MDLLVIGLGVTGSALVRHAASAGWHVVVAEDAPNREGHAERRAYAETLGARVVEAPGLGELAALVDAADLVVPSPGVPFAHPVYETAFRRRTRLLSEIELAATVADVPIVAVTGTNGKSTVTTLVADMLEASGRRSCVAGNIGRPLIEAVEAGEADVVVAEVSSFQLEFTESFCPAVAVVLNVAADHLDWHPTFQHYRDAKARIFANQTGDDVVVLNADDPACVGMGEEAPARVEWFSVSGAAGCHRADAGTLLTPAGECVVAVADLHVRRPHDVANSLASSAAALAAGATLDGVAAALRAFRGLPHRLSLVGDAGGVRWYDDSKATNPHATLAGVAGFDSVILLAGGRNKGLDLGVLTAAAARIRHVVAFGEAGGEVEAAFAGVRPVERAGSMHDAVVAASRIARPGDAVVLSPACASFDAYPDYAARGRDFTAEVTWLLGNGTG